MPEAAKTYEEQITLLESRGLSVPDHASAIQWLRHHNYYRLSAYRFPFTKKGDPDTFLPGTTFDQIRALYRFDAQLRQLLFEACKCIEISIRARWAYEVGHQLGPLGYRDKRHFSRADDHDRAMERLQSEIQRSNEEFIRHHRDRLQMPWPPVWVISEVASFGTISRLLTNTLPPRLRQDIADTYSLDEKTLCSLIHHLTVLRNMVAHHSRVWNRGLTFLVKLPKKKPKDLGPNFHVKPDKGNRRRLYNTLVLLVYLIQCIEPNHSWPTRCSMHLMTLDPNLIPSMGFPPDWRTRPIWAGIDME